MKWNRFTIKTKTEAEDMIICTLAEIGVEGVEIQDHQPLTEEDKAVQTATVEHDTLMMQRAGLCFPAVVAIDLKGHQRDFLFQIHNVFPPKCGILGSGRVPPDPCVTRSAHVVPS